MPAPAVENVWLRLPFAPESAGEARRRFDSWLAENSQVGSHRDDWRDDVQLVLSELVGNAVRHASPLPGGTLEVGWSLGEGGLEIAVRDGGAPQLPELQSPAPMDVSGRGLTLVEMLCVLWWVDHSEQRTTMHALMA